MKTSILIIGSHMGLGGVQKSLISLLENIDYSKYNIDLLLFRASGLFMDMIPPEVNILQEVHIDIKKLLRKRSIAALYHCGIVYLNKIVSTTPEQYHGRYWKHMKKVLPKLQKEYDVAISYDESALLYYLVDLVIAKKKITWTHTVYTADWNYKPELDRAYYAKVDNIVVVSPKCAEITGGVFPEYKNKIRVIKNIVDKNLITKMAVENNPYQSYPSGFIKIVSVGRVSSDKGCDLALDAIKILRNKEYNVLWFLVGEGAYREELKKQSRKYAIYENIIFIDNQANPYPYIYYADIFLHTSRVEACALVVEEAKKLNKPMVVTNYETVKNQITHGKNGLITEMNPTAIANQLSILIDNPSIRNRLIKNLREERYDDKSVILDKFYDLLI